MPFHDSNPKEERPHDVLWFRDDAGNPVEVSRVSGEEAGWKPMTAADFKKTFPDTGDETEPAK